MDLDGHSRVAADQTRGSRVAADQTRDSRVAEQPPATTTKVIHLPLVPGRVRVFRDVALHAVKKGFSHDAGWKETIACFFASLVIALVAILITALSRIVY
jgi:hypothetical protein